MNVLKQLTVTGNVSKIEFESQYDWLFPKHEDTYSIIVIEDTKLSKVIGTATLLLERKFVRQTGTVSNPTSYLLKFI